MHAGGARRHALQVSAVTRDLARSRGFERTQQAGRLVIASEPPAQRGEAVAPGPTNNGHPVAQSPRTIRYDLLPRASSMHRREPAS